MPMTPGPATLKTNIAPAVEATNTTTANTPSATPSSYPATASTPTSHAAAVSDPKSLPAPPTNGSTVPDSASADPSPKPHRTSELIRSASSSDITSLPHHDEPANLHRAFSDLDLAHHTASDHAAADAATAKAPQNAAVKSETQQGAGAASARPRAASKNRTAPKRSGSVLFHRDKHKAGAQAVPPVLGLKERQPSTTPQISTPEKVKDATPSSEPPSSSEKLGKGRSFFANLTRKPWRALSSASSSPLPSPSPSQQATTQSTAAASETLHTAPNGDTAKGVPPVPAVPDNLRSFTPTPAPPPPVPETPATTENVMPKQRQPRAAHERRKESVSSLKAISTKRPNSRGRSVSCASPSSSSGAGLSGTASGAQPSGEGSSTSSSSSTSFFKRPDVMRQNSSKSVRARASLERLAASVGMATTEVPPVPPTPTLPASVTGRGSGPANGNDASAKKKDELWGVFRTLDNDLLKYRSKAGNLKTNIIRNSLLPALHRCANHPSNHGLRPEDLDRRVNILNRWWTALLDGLNGGQAQVQVANTDRPSYFEAINMIMTRPEFKYPFLPAPFATTSPTHNDPIQSPTTASHEVRDGLGSISAKGLVTRSKSSLESAGSDFLAESINHNVRNILNQNLLSQLGFCIDRMSTRHCSASLVAFAGRTCAYAFMYCPDVADTLVRLWNISPDGLRRVIAMYDPEYNMKAMISTSEEVASSFPIAIRSLAFTSHVATVRMLRKRAIPPISTQHINWFGPWMTRWAGGDTDLFFLFVKHYYMLVAEYISLPNTPRQKLLYVPGLVLVHTQILKILEITLSRSANPIPDDRSSGSANQVTFDDLLDAAETTAASPLGMANSLRHMSENRLLLLLRDVIADPQANSDLRLTFVESICGLLRAVTRKTSLFDHNACFVLMDLAQEFTFVIASFAEQIGRNDLVDWDFWLDVFVQMLQSNNSLTEVRAFAFWYTMWDQVCANEKYKERLCLDLLLDDSIFYRYFNHWSAMVRAYYHRLLCWRLARYQGEATPLDQEIFLTLQRKLHIIYEFCVSYQKHNFLITSPSQPAPGRQLLIAKNESLITQSQFICLDHSFSPPSPEASPPPKKRWAALRSIFLSPANPKPGEVTPPGSRGSDRSSESSVDSTRASFSDNSLRPTAIREKNQGKASSITPSSFRFSLEWVERPSWSGKNPLLFPPAVPMPLRIYLQSRNHKNFLSQRNCTATDQAAGILASLSMNSTLQPAVKNASCNGGSQASGAPASSHLVTPSGSESEATNSSKTSSNASDATKSDSERAASVSSDHGNDAADDADVQGRNDGEKQSSSMDDDTTVRCITDSRPSSPEKTPRTTTDTTSADNPSSTDQDRNSPTSHPPDRDDSKLPTIKPPRQAFSDLQEDFLTACTPTTPTPPTHFRRPNSQRARNVGVSPGASKYAGRSLSEWAHVVDECDAHYEKRREAGVAADGLVEVPSLGVENFRK